MSRPLIGVPGMWSSSVHGMRFDGVAVAAAVLRCIDRAGGEPVVMFPGSIDGVGNPAAQLARFDGVVLPGGADVDPARYGAEPDEHYWPADYDGQDAYEAGILAGCLEADIPLLAICRGLQLLNVSRGGTLIQHLEPGAVTHKDAVHPVAVPAGSLLAAAAGAGTVEVSSYHHQAVGDLGEGLRVTATAADGVVEALELPGSPLLAVQWHPEDLAAGNPADHALFQWVVEAARQRRDVLAGLAGAGVR
ncbi:gamma-glutamyl-gamma-aminobutyrate hydrolase family protein [Arthrobacter sp. I2-34]|uniref:Gamma-glutamyl-gamma-aminobutyrate hydrolase family protein n=1 Tax=Arthrobacter hankyongi TaxID=2904801 RepID=A0ABS9L9X7_9MICC|nr:gamma-glutamyl-gamma-aminobutyrate hydrolase family protein [Arthrobacter hankyongi]MCG2623264.1 gamma-glutamyl-gamma-aminobutyrate hydrolase family protein [Arthrobacter hankyongi]